jgi:hypothetical protein
MMLSHSQKERAMKQETINFERMQADHRQWDYEQLRWRSDIETWQRDHELALSQLSKLQEFICQHGEALQSHAEALEQLDQGLRDHHRAMSEYEIHGEGERLQETLATEHGMHAEQHHTQHEVHERVKKHHHTVMAHLAMLKAAFEEAM